MLIDRVISCLSINRTTSGVCVTRMYPRVLFEVLKVRVRRVIHSHNKHIHNKRIRKPTRRSQVRRNYDPNSSVCPLLSFSCRQHQIVIHMRTTARNRTICFVWWTKSTSYGSLCFAPASSFSGSSNVSSRFLKDYYGLASLEGVGLSSRPLAMCATAALIRYVKHTRPETSSALQLPRTYDVNDCMNIDEDTWRNLEISHTARTGSTQGSLLRAIDQPRHQWDDSSSRVARVHWDPSRIVSINVVEDRWTTRCSSSCSVGTENITKKKNTHVIRHHVCARKKS